MNKSRFRFARVWIYPFMTLLLACNLPAERPVGPTPYIPTVISSASPIPTGFVLPPTSFPSTPFPIVQPSVTLAPILISTNTSIPIPCNRAEFVGEVSIPDGTQISIGASFTKVWRLRNTGSCTWAPGYVLLFDHGDPMNASPGQPWPYGNVPPGAVVDVSVTLNAPSQPGTYQAFFRLRSPDNIVFGVGPSGQDSFWVKIVVPQPTATPTNTPKPPSFDQIVQFGGGGGRTYLCGIENYPGSYSSIYITQHRNILYMCIYGGNFRSPFSLKFNQIGGVTIQQIDFLPAAIMINNSFSVQWKDYAAANTNRGTFIDIPVGNGLSIRTQSVEILIGIPIDLPTGGWQVQASGDFQVERIFVPERTGNPPYIAAVNQGGGNQFAPIFDDRGLLYLHLLKLEENGGINVIGTDYPADTPVYVLLYHDIDSGTYQLESQQTIQTDSSGSISIELSGRFTAGDSYLLVGATDPNAHIIGDNGHFDTNLPHDFFKLVSP